MHKVIIALGLALAMVVPVASSIAGPDPKPKDPTKKVQELAGACVLEGMGAGAFQTLTAEELAAYCVTVAVQIFEADYTAP